MQELYITTDREYFKVTPNGIQIASGKKRIPQLEKNMYLPAGYTRGRLDRFDFDTNGEPEVTWVIE